MKIRVLGCSGARFPGHKVPGFLLNDDILFDAGSLTGVLQEKAQLKIKNIFITHAHLDHIRGIPSLADNIIIGKKDYRVNIFSIPPVLKTIKRHLFNSAMWPDFTMLPKPEDAILNLIELKEGKSIKIDTYMVTPYKVNHTIPTVGYLVENKKMRRFFYTGDTGPTHRTWEKIGNKKIHCLVIDVSLPNSMEDVALRTGHLTPLLLKEELSKIQSMPEHVYITHVKPQYLNTIRKDLKNLNIKNLKILKDGDTIRV